VGTTRLIIGFALAGVALTGCAGSTSTGPPSTGTANESNGATGELPTLVGDFDRVCETQVGFSGADLYEPAPGLHPVALFEDTGEPPSLSHSTRSLPAGWAVENDDDYADNSELAAVQLVACSRLVETKPNGTCEFEGEDGAPPTSLEKTDTTYELTVYSARTGEVVRDPQTLVASPAECPMLVFLREGDTKWFNKPTDDQYINALKPLVNS
jgi:hypothetical protein